MQSTTPKRRILYVEGNLFVCESIAKALRSAGHDVFEAGSLDEALALFRARTFDLVITDLSERGVPGDQLAAAIKAIAPSQPVVITTQEDWRERASRAAGEVLCKPFDFKTLLEIIEKLP